MRMACAELWLACGRGDGRGKPGSCWAIKHVHYAMVQLACALSSTSAGCSQVCCPNLRSFMFVLDGVVEVVAGSERVTLHADDFAYIPAHLKHTVTSASGAGLLLFERRYALKVDLEGCS